MRADFVVVDNTTLKKLTSFYAEQDKWTRSMIKNHPSDEDAYWRHVAYIMAQFDGLYDGYRAVAEPEWVRLRSLQLLLFFLSFSLRRSGAVIVWLFVR